MRDIERFNAKHARTSKLTARDKPMALYREERAKHLLRYKERLLTTVLDIIDSPSRYAAQPAPGFADDLVAFIATGSTPTAFPASLTEALAAAKVFRLEMPSAVSTVRRADWTTSYELDPVLVERAADSIATTRLRKAMSLTKVPQPSLSALRPPPTQPVVTPPPSGVQLVPTSFRPQEGSLAALFGPPLPSISHPALLPHSVPPPPPLLPRPVRIEDTLPRRVGSLRPEASPDPAQAASLPSRCFNHGLDRFARLRGAAAAAADSVTSALFLIYAVVVCLSAVIAMATSAIHSLVAAHLMAYFARHADPADREVLALLSRISAAIVYALRPEPVPTSDSAPSSPPHDSAPHRPPLAPPPSPPSSPPVPGPPVGDSGSLLTGI